LQGWFHNRPNPGFYPELYCCALSAVGFVFSALEAYSQQSRSKKYAALGETPALRPAGPALQNLRKGKVSFEHRPRRRGNLDH
jgi:hypothetical protein